MDVIGKTLRGIYRDRLIGPDNRLLYDSGWIANTVVNRCRILLAGLIKGELEGGIHHLAVGGGDETWDTEGVPAPDPDTTTGLVNGYAPTIPYPNPDLDLTVVYLDNKKSQLQITATLRPGYPAPEAPSTVYPLREFGLFGGPEGDYMINCVRHSVIPKHESTTLIREIRLYF
jgi:hypothetical protein